MKDNRLDNRERLRQIFIAIKEIELFVSEVDENKFINDSLISSAALYQFCIMGEAVVHIDKDFLDKHDYPWYKVRAFRNLISHEYFQIDLRLVWEVIAKDLPELKHAIGKILEPGP